MRTAIYVRISKDSEGEGVGVARQREACMALAGSMGYSVMRVYTDNDVSAYSGKTRPDFEKLMADMAASRFDLLLCYHPDRLYRSMKDLERVIDVAEATGVRIKTISAGDIDLSTSSGRTNARLLGVVARSESERNGERRRAANFARAMKGQWRNEGGRVFGFNPDGTHHPVEAPLIVEAVDDILADTSIHSIARRWNDLGVTTVKGKPFTNLHVRRLLSNPRLAGLVVYQKKIIGKGQWEPIVDEDSWRGLMALMTSRSNGLAFERRHLLSGVLVCGVCDAPLYGTYSHGRDRPMSYVCNAKGAHVGRAAASLETYVEAVVLNYLEDHGVSSDIEHREDNTDLGELHKRRDALVATKDQLATLLRKGVLDVAGVERESAVLTSQIEEITDQLVKASRIHPAAALLDDDSDTPLAQRWELAPIDLKARVISALMRIVVHPAGRGPRTFNPDLVELQWKDS